MMTNEQMWEQYWQPMPNTFKYVEHGLTEDWGPDTIDIKVEEASIAEYEALNLNAAVLIPMFQAYKSGEHFLVAKLRIGA